MFDRPIPDSERKNLILVLVGMCAVILSALAFEHIGGYIPCKLCLQQREPWYAGIPVMAIALLAMFLTWPARVVRACVLIAFLLMLYSLFLGVNHAGVEWGWWAGPGDCGVVEGSISGNVNDLLNQLETTTPPSCDKAALRVLGLSFAGWNALVSLVLAFFLFKVLRA